MQNDNDSAVIPIKEKLKVLAISDELEKVFEGKFGRIKTPEILARLYFFSMAHHQIKDGQYVLDIGAGDSWYRKFFEHAHYVTTDYAVGSEKADYSGLDSICDAIHLPFADSSFEVILSIGTLEHMSEPEMALKEMYRILKPGGRVYMMVPFSTGCHQIPYDFYRYTKFGLQHLFKKVGFESWVIEASNGMIWTLMGNSKRLVRFVPNPFVKKCARIFVARVIEPIAAKVDHWDKERLFPRHWICQINKPS